MTKAFAKGPGIGKSWCQATTGTGLSTARAHARNKPNRQMKVRVCARTSKIIQNWPLALVRTHLYILIKELPLYILLASPTTALTGFDAARTRMPAGGGAAPRIRTRTRKRYISLSLGPHGHTSSRFEP